MWATARTIMAGVVITLVAVLVLAATVRVIGSIIVRAMIAWWVWDWEWAWDMTEARSRSGDIRR